MLEIKECKDIEKYADKLSKISTDGEIHVSESYENGKVTGYGIFALSPEKVEIFDVYAGKDLYLFDGIVRALMFKGMLKGIEKVQFLIDDEFEVTQLEKLKFVKNGDKTLKNINDFMNNCKKCKEIN